MDYRSKMQGKRCPQCDIIKPPEDYYINNRKCKECVKSNVRERELIKISTPEGLEKERQRGREKYHRLNYKDNQKTSPENKKKIQEAYKNKYPEKNNAKNKTTCIKRILKGNHLHHWNYNIEYVKDVFELLPSDHYELHRFITYDPVLYIYKKLDGTPLDTKEKHEALITELKIKIYN